jgi:glutathione S-transferase
MLTVHHPAFSRSLRVLWLLEEMGVDYELVSYARTAESKAPPGLMKIHPLGKAPVVVDGDLTLAESSAILRYIENKFGSDTLMPARGTNERAIAEGWLDYPESSAALPFIITLLGKRTGGLNEQMAAFAEKQLATTLAYIAAEIGDGPFLMGKQLTLADIQISYLLAVADKAGMLQGSVALLSLERIFPGRPRFGLMLDAPIPPTHKIDR